MHKKVTLKRSMESSKSKSNWKSNKESKQGESMSNECKANNMLTIFENTKAKAKGAKALAAHANSPTCPKAILCPN